MEIGLPYNLVPTGDPVQHGKRIGKRTYWYVKGAPKGKEVVITTEEEVLADKGDAYKLGFKVATDIEQTRIKNLIVAEINVAHQEGTPTSRLTSLYNKI